MVNSTYREAALYYQEMARSAVRSRKIVVARDAYLRCIHAWKLAVIEFPSLKICQHAVQVEYARFVRSDRTYRTIFPEIKKYIEKHPDTTHHDLVRALHGFNQDELNYILNFAEEQGEIVKVKKGPDVYCALAPKRNQNKLQTLFHKLYSNKLQRLQLSLSASDGYSDGMRERKVQLRSKLRHSFSIRKQEGEK